MLHLVYLKAKLYALFYITFVPVCVCVYSFYTIYYSPKKWVRQILSSNCKTNQAGFTNWISFLPSNLMEEISLNTESLSTNV